MYAYFPEGIFLTVDSILYNTKLCIQGKLVEAGLAINNGKIIKIAKETNLPLASEKINLKGHITLPGIIDTHVHLRDQQLAYKENFSTGTAAAAAGGVTLVVDMPNNKPATLDVISLKERINLAKKHVLVNVAFNSAFPKKLSEISEIVKAGGVGFKVYLAEGIGGIDIDNNDTLLAAFKEAAKNGVPVLVHAEDKKIIEERKKEMEEAGRNGIKAFLYVHSPEAEVQAIQQIVPLAKKSGVHVHICHVSSALGLEAVSLAKKTGLNLTCEATPQNLFLSSEQFRSFGKFGLTVPPIRRRKDASALWEGLKSGCVDSIASDHAPHSRDEKNVVSVWEAKAGIPGLETMLPLLLTRVNVGWLSLAELTKVVAVNPARIFGLGKRGVLREGYWADFVVVDMKLEYVIDSSRFFSKARYSPFDGVCVKGKAVKTFVGGEIVFDDGEIVSSGGVGKVVCRQL